VGKYIITILFVLAVFLLGLAGYIYFRGTDGTSSKVKNTKIEVKNNENSEIFLTDLGWYSANTLTLLSGITVRTKEISGIEVVHSDLKQPFLQQGDGMGNVFASVDTKVENSKLKFTIHVDPKRLMDTQDKNWWIDSQVIRAMNKMLNPNFPRKPEYECNRSQLVRLVQVRDGIS
jgi:hypothetical protein